MANSLKVEPALGTLASRWALASRALLCLASPTWALADWLKRDQDDAGRTNVIVHLNHIYLGSAMAAALATFALNWNALSGGYPWWAHLVRSVWFGFLWSRCTEVFAAFYRDAFEKLEQVPKRESTLNPSQRVRLALKSYAELILNFGLMYWLLPRSVWKSGDAPAAFTDILFYSASTITTSGGGGFIPAAPSLQFLTAYEIACGLILLVVCFAIYAGRALNIAPAHAPLSPSGPATPTGRVGDGSASGTSSKT